MGKVLDNVRARKVLRTYGENSVTGRMTRALLEKLRNLDPSASPLAQGQKHWIQNHLSGMCDPLNEEHIFVMCLGALESYCDSYEIKYQTKIGEDYVLGEGLLQIAHGLNTLLNGECRRLDPGEISSIIHTILTHHGFPEDS